MFKLFYTTLAVQRDIKVVQGTAGAHLKVPVWCGTPRTCGDLARQVHRSLLLTGETKNRKACEEKQPERCTGKG